MDQDGSGEIEFNEFVDIIKCGRKQAKFEEMHRKTKESKVLKGQPPETNTAAIYTFFKNLTNGDLMSKEKANMPFSLFISAHRRQMIINSMMKDGCEQKEGERIKNNY